MWYPDIGVGGERGQISSFYTTLEWLMDLHFFNPFGPYESGMFGSQLI